MTPGDRRAGRIQRATSQDWATFVETLRAHSPEVSWLPGQPVTTRKGAAEPGAEYR
jgi:hypothetical protein